MKRALLYAAVAAMFLFAVLTAFVLAGLRDPDDAAVREWLPSHPAAWLTSTAAVVRLLGATAPLALTVFVAAALWRWHSRRAAVLLVGAVAGALLTSVVVKVLVNRMGPAGAETSFPSSSVVVCVAFWGCLATLVLLQPRRRAWYRALLVVAVVLIAAIGPSRLAVGEHWASDVLAGYLWGIGVLASALWLYNPPRVTPRRRAANAPSPA